MSLPDIVTGTEHQGEPLELAPQRTNHDPVACPLPLPDIATGTEHQGEPLELAPQRTNHDPVDYVLYQAVPLNFHHKAINYMKEVSVGSWRQLQAQIVKVSLTT